MTWLITGAGGILGSAFVNALSGENVAIAGRSDLNVADPRSIDRLIAHTQPQIVINCAAHTDVEGAEDHPQAAYAANALLPGLLAWSCRRTDSVLVHISSTGCYGNWKDEPYTEEDEVRPLSVHHRSKISGERAVIEAGCEHLIVRTGWLFGGTPDHGKNFVWKRLVEGARVSEMTSDATQRGNPTWVDEVAKQVLHLCALNIRGTFNAVAQGHATRAEYVAEIMKLADLPCVVRPGPAFKRKAMVSCNETAINSRINILGCDIMAKWQDTLGLYIRSLCNIPGVQS